MKNIKLILSVMLLFVFVGFQNVNAQGKNNNKKVNEHVKKGEGKGRKNEGD